MVASARRLTGICVAVWLAVAVASAQDPPIVIKAARVLDGKGKVLTNVGLVIQGSKIIRIDSAPQSATYDLTQLTVMPGWIETHSHIQTHFNRNTGTRAGVAEETPEQQTLYTLENLQKTLLAGFTTVQSPGTPADKDFREFINDGRIAGPRLLTSLGGIRTAAADKVGATTPREIRQQVRQLLVNGADVVKIWASGSIQAGDPRTLSLEQLQAACGQATLLGMRSMVHAQTDETARDAVLAGCGTVEHGAQIDDATLDLMVKRGVYFDPHNHLRIYNHLEKLPNDFTLQSFDARANAGMEFMEKALVTGNDTVKRAIAKGVKIIFGTDATPGIHGRNYDEMIYRVREAGQSPMAAIISATSLSAESLRLGDQIGTIAPGMEADIIATDGDPLSDITAVRRVVFVMKGGKVYKNVATTPKPATNDEAGR